MALDHALSGIPSYPRQLTYAFTSQPTGFPFGAPSAVHSSPRISSWLPPSQARCARVGDYFSASTVCYSDVVGIIAPKSPFVKPSKENLFKPLSGQRRFGITDFSALRELSAQTFGTAGLAFQKNGLFSLHRAEKQKTESFLKKTERIFKKRVTFLQKNRL